MKIDGKQIANIIFQDLKIKVKKLQEKNIIPHLAIVLVGDDPASLAYVNQKKIKAEQIGAKITLYQYPNSVTTKTLLDCFNDLNHLSKMHGIIAQQPLPSHINLKEITEAIDPKKDVDGFHPKSKFEPPIFMTVLTLFNQINIYPQGKNIVILGKGETGGKPIIKGFEKMGIKPLVIDSKTSNPLPITKKADIIISAVGKSNVIKPDMIKKGVILISIGLSKGSDGKLHGDYNEEEIKNKASFYTPTPGGVGPVNVAMLLKNLVTAAEN